MPKRSPAIILPVYQSLISYLAFTLMIQNVYTPYFIYADIVLKFAWNLCICRSIGEFARHLVNIQLALRPTSQ